MKKYLFLFFLLLYASVSFADPFGGSMFFKKASGGTNPPAIDGTAQSASASTQTNASSTFTVSNSGDLLVIAVQTGTGSVTNSVASISDTSNLMWTEQMVQTFDSAHREISLWTAPASGTYSGTVTVHLASAISYSSRFFLTAITNPNVTVLDANAANPCHNNSGNAQTQSASCVISTNHANDILFAFNCSNSGLGTVTRPSGFTQVISSGTAADFSYKVVSSPLSSVTESWSWTGTSDYNAASITAIQGL